MRVDTEDAYDGIRTNTVHGNGNDNCFGFLYIEIKHRALADL